MRLMGSIQRGGAGGAPRLRRNRSIEEGKARGKGTFKGSIRRTGDRGELCYPHIRDTIAMTPPAARPHCRSFWYSGSGALLYSVASARRKNSSDSAPSAHS